MRLAGVVALAALLPVTAAAQEAEDTLFDRAMNAALFNAGSAGSLLRCSGLFRAFRVYAGEDTEVGRGAARRETDLAVASVVVWQSENGEDSMEAALDIVVPMVTDAADLFLARMSDSRDATGSVFDESLEVELAFCDTIHGEISAQVSE